VTPTLLIVSTTELSKLVCKLHLKKYSSTVSDTCNSCNTTLRGINTLDHAQMSYILELVLKFKTESRVCISFYNNRSYVITSCRPLMKFSSCQERLALLLFILDASKLEDLFFKYVTNDTRVLDSL